MTRKAKQSKRTAKNSKRTKGSGELEDETETAIQSEVAEASQAIPAIPEAEVVTESQQDVAAGAPATESGTAPKATRSDDSKANIKEACGFIKSRASLPRNS